MKFIKIHGAFFIFFTIFTIMFSLEYNTHFGLDHYGLTYDKSPGEQYYTALNHIMDWLFIPLTIWIILLVLHKDKKNETKTT